MGLGRTAITGYIHGTEMGSRSMLMVLCLLIRIELVFPSALLQLVIQENITVVEKSRTELSPAKPVLKFLSQCMVSFRNLHDIANAFSVYFLQRIFSSSSIKHIKYYITIKAHH